MLFLYKMNVYSLQIQNALSVLQDTNTRESTVDYCIEINVCMYLFREMDLFVPRGSITQ